MFIARIIISISAFVRCCQSVIGIFFLFVRDLPPDVTENRRDPRLTHFEVELRCFCLIVFIAARFYHSIDTESSRTSVLFPNHVEACAIYFPRPRPFAILDSGNACRQTFTPRPPRFAYRICGYYATMHRPNGRCIVVLLIC